MKENIEVGIQMAGFCILIGLSIFVTYNDILRIFWMNTLTEGWKGCQT